MISSTSTLFLATLVFGAASVIGAPIRISDTLSVPVARADIITPVVPVARAIVDVEDHRRRSNLGTVSRRSARLVYERDEPFAEVVTAREPVDIPAASEVTQRDEPQRRYPRRHLRDFFEKREPATSIKETTMVVTKTTVHDTPADAAAAGIGAAAVAAASGANPSASALVFTIPIPPGVKGQIKGDKNVVTSTIISVSSATTILQGSATATATSSGSAAATETASASGTASATDATATATASATDATATGTATATDATATATGTATSTDTAATSTSTGTADNTGDNKTATDNKTDATTGDDKTAAGDNKTATDDNKTGDDKTATANTATPGLTVVGDSTTPAANADGGDDKTNADAARRAVKVSTAPVARRKVARSGASWASSVRRSNNY